MYFLYATCTFRINSFGEDSTQQLLLQPLSAQGAASLAGTYQCSMVAVDNVSNKVVRTIEVKAHGKRQ